MQSNRSTEPPDFAGPGGQPVLVLVADGEAAAHDARDHPTNMDLPRTVSRAKGPLARLLSVLRGDKYMADAYEPAWSAPMERRAPAAPKERALLHTTAGRR